ncbi:MAG TPA: hypothetical protein VJT71_15875 [Pyrinomonadaceae bacterium]|nr:hypothetical protein [Pyrinomonadaceae bacterium]
MFRSLLICVACLSLALNAGSQTKTYRTAEDLQRDITFLLLEKNIDEVTSQLARTKATSSDALLYRLAIYSRAGQELRVGQTLEALANAPDWRCPAAPDLKYMIRNVRDDLAGVRFYYERLCPDDTDGAEAFVRIWVSQGDLKELDQWLASRAAQRDEWLMLQLGVRKKLGTAREILDRLAAEVRANPADRLRLERYLRANNYVENLQDASWIADVVEMHTATDYFELGGRLRYCCRPVAAKLLEKSLTIPFTPADAKMVNQMLSRASSIGMRPVNPEKQLRYWTKRSLAETYNMLKRPLDAQPIMEELVAMKGDDIILEDVHQMAGATQGASGLRVIETAILRDEAARRTSADYWLERAMYYDGRQEYERERESFREGLIALSENPRNAMTDAERLKVVSRYAFFLGDDDDNRPELEKLLRTELANANPESDYAFQIARLITQSELDLDDLRDALLARQPKLLARMLGRHEEWSNEESGFIEDVADRESVTPDEKDKIWSALESLVTTPGSTRAFRLAEAMGNSNAWRRAIPLLRGYVEQRPLNREWDSDSFTYLLDAYLETDDWQSAEKYLFAQKEILWRSMPGALTRMAMIAAQRGAHNEAIRLWKLSANIDRRNMQSLSLLAQTGAKPRLIAMYSQMKKDDPQSAIPDRALRLLQ